MRIAIAGPGYTQTPIIPLISELVRLGHEVHFLTLDSTIDKPHHFFDEHVHNYYFPSRQRARHLALSFFAQEIAYLENALREIQPDIVHAHWTYEFAEAAVRSELPHLVTMHDSPWVIFGLYRDAYRFFRLLMALKTIPRIKSLAVVSPHLIRQARLHGYFRRIAVVPNGIVVPAFGPDEIRRQPSPSIRIVTVGNSGRLKNVQASVRAFDRIRQQFPTAELHLFGPGLDETFAARSPQVYGHGPVSHSALMQYLAENTDLVIHSSFQESFGVILAEAMARRVPCIAGRHSGGVPYVLGPELEFMLVNVQDARQLAEKAISVLNDRTEYFRISEMAYRRVEAEFSHKKMACKYIHLYKAILTNSPI